MSVAFPSGVAGDVLDQRELIPDLRRLPVDKVALAELFKAQRSARQEQHALAKEAGEAMHRLVDVCRQRCGQSYKVRALLYSLWNGQNTSLLELVAVDWSIRRDLLVVMGAFGYEGPGLSFFYDALSDAFKAAGQFEWFCEAYREDLQPS